MVTTRQDVADHINTNFDDVYDDYEKGVLDQQLDPEVARILTKILGHSTWLLFSRNNQSNTNRIPSESNEDLGWNYKKDDMRVISKQDVADYINTNFDMVFNDYEKTVIDEKLNPVVATILIKLLGDVACLIQARDS